jgi:hypothetical protein
VDTLGRHTGHTGAGTGILNRPGSNSGSGASSTAGAYQSRSACVAAHAPAQLLDGGSPLDRQSTRDDGAQSSGGSQSSCSSRREYRRAGRGGSGGAGGVGKMHFAPRSLGAARANPQPQQQPQQQQRSPNAGAGWSPVTGGQQQHQYSQHQQQRYNVWGPQSSAQRPHRGAPLPHQQPSAAIIPVPKSSPFQPWQQPALPSQPTSA